MSNKDRCPRCGRKRCFCIIELCEKKFSVGDRMSFYDREGKSISMMEWVPLLGDPEYCRVGFDEDDGWSVSTVWIGINYAHSYVGAPLFFETLVFVDGNIDSCFRWSSLLEAREGHERAVGALNSGLYEHDVLK